jgi:NitT/TauT family transport system permease protein
VLNFEEGGVMAQTEANNVDSARELATVTELPFGEAPTPSAQPERAVRKKSKFERKLRASLHPRTWLPGAIGLGSIAVIWSIISANNHLLIPSIGSIYTTLVDRPGFFVRNGLVTMQETAVGLSCSFAAAFLLAVVMVHVKPFERAVMPVVVIMNVTPIIAIAPALVVAFGFGMTPKYIVTGMIVFFPILINSMIGLRSVDRQALDLLRTLHASKTEILFRLRIPSALPFLFAAARVCFPVSIIGAVVAEFAASGQQRGLGSIIQTAAALGDLPPIYAAIACLAFLGLSLTLLVTLLESRVLSWHTSTQRGDS